MSSAFLEHVNVTVSDPEATAKRLETWFGWKVRWKGAAKNGGTTYHIGNDTSYIAAYTPPEAPKRSDTVSYHTHGGLNHVAVVVDDLDATEDRIKAGGYRTHNHGDYEPGRRFYFDDDDGIEFEVVSYAD
ncbi:VOC family protein [Roseibium sediminicola]|uniref:VOC family protein n=1 Tax=Roseibium sediminicola TaxID=2933272 RepID=A0ABT0GQK1_9HYPH|nr:VOC family protein [Roseibium sp. CAU 1639]MCK7611689.1 VOC family protein [Roseibium sp. CAU 1639]